MQETSSIQTNMRLRRHLAVGYILLIIYASLSPFSGWQQPELGFLVAMAKPFQLPISNVDIIANVIAYIPCGFLLYMSMQTRGRIVAACIATLVGFALSLSMEYAQMYLPSRTSSYLDLFANTGGCLAGVLLAAATPIQGWLKQSIYLRYRLAYPGKSADFGLALVALWAFAQSNPALPILSNIFIGAQSHVTSPASLNVPLSWQASITAALNMLMLGVLLFLLFYRKRPAAIAIAGILVAVIMVKFAAAVLLLKSWALLMWLDDAAILGLLAGAIILFGASMISRRKLIWFSACASLVYFVLAHSLPDTAPSSLALYQWRYGNLHSLNNLSLLLLLNFPLLLLIFLWRIRNLPGAAL